VTTLARNVVCVHLLYPVVLPNLARPPRAEAFSRPNAKTINTVMCILVQEQGDHVCGKQSLSCLFSCVGHAANYAQSDHIDPIHKLLWGWALGPLKASAHSGRVIGHPTPPAENDNKNGGLTTMQLPTLGSAVHH